MWRPVTILLLAALLICVGALAKGWRNLYWKFSYRDVDIAAVSSFPFDEYKGTLQDIPDSVRKLDGKRVRVDGWMIPLDQAEPVSQFAIVPWQLGEWWQSPRPSLCQVVVAKTPRGQPIAYFPDEEHIYGTLHVSIESDDGFIVSVFQMDVDRVEPISHWKLHWMWMGAGGLVLAVLTIIAQKILLRRTRVRQGLCLGCGYDLRASSERCPECGQSVVKSWAMPIQFSNCKRRHFGKCGSRAVVAQRRLQGKQRSQIGNILPPPRGQH